MSILLPILFTRPAMCTTATSFLLPSGARRAQELRTREHTWEEGGQQNTACERRHLDTCFQLVGTWWEPSPYLVCAVTVHEVRQTQTGRQREGLPMHSNVNKREQIRDQGSKLPSYVQVLAVLTLLWSCFFVLVSACDGE